MVSNRSRALVALGTALAAALVGTGAAARAEMPDACYALAAGVLTGPGGAELTLRVTAAEGCAVPAGLKKVQLKARAGDGGVEDVRNLADVALTDGTATFELGTVARGRRVEADVLIQTDDPKRTWVVRSEATALLRPDVSVTALSAPAQTLTTRPIGVTAEVAHLSGDVGATATVTLAAANSTIAARELALGVGERVSVTFADVALTSAAAVELTVRVDNVRPDETDATNNVRSTTVDVTEHELARSRLILDNLGGYGAQFNHHVFANITVAPPGTIGGLEPKVDALEPHIVRIFFNDRDESALFPDRLASFIEVVRMANETGATINITYQTAARARLNPAPFMAQFAAVLDDLVRNRGFTNVRWVTIQNEPNRTNVTKDQYNALHRALHAELVARGLRTHIKMMVGDLVEAADNGTQPHREWMDYITANMLDLVDAYSEHIYWNHWQGGRMEYRLRDTRKLMFEELTPEERRPVYLIEYGVRGQQTNFPGKPNLPGGYYLDGTDMMRTNVAAFQQLWFNIVAAQYGFDGTAKWDAYWGRYDNTIQAYYMIGPAAEGWPLFPTYHSLRMLFQTTARGWQIVGLDPWADDDWKIGEGERWDPLKEYDQREKEIAAWAGPAGELTLIGLDTSGRDLNAASAESSSYSIGGLAPLTTFNLGVWNRTGNGQTDIGGTVTTNANGVARFDVPLHAAFALTTVPVS